MSNNKMTKTVKKKPGRVRTFINSIIFNRETPKQGRKRKEKENQNLAATKKQQEEYKNMEFKKGGKLKKSKKRKYQSGGFMSKAAPFLGAAGMIANSFAKKKKGGTMKYKRGGQFNQYD